MLIFSIPLLLITTLSVIFYDPADRLKNKDLDFRILESDELYFRNLRLNYYRSTIHKESQFEILKYDGFENLPNSQTLDFNIVCNWMQDEAYILPVLRDSSEWKGLIMYRIDTSEGTIEWQLGLLDNIEMMMLAKRTYEALHEKEARFYLQYDIEPSVEIWKDHDERKAELRVLTDYFTLIGALR